MARYIDATHLPNFEITLSNGKNYLLLPFEHLSDIPTADVVEVDVASEQIIRKKAEVSDYWLKDVKSYRATQGYSDIEHDVDNFLRGYNEAVEDILAILDGKQLKGE